MKIWSKISAVFSRNSDEKKQETPSTGPQRTYWPADADKVDVARPQETVVSKSMFWPYAKEESPAPEPQASSNMFWPYSQDVARDDQQATEMPSGPPRQFIPYAPDAPKAETESKPVAAAPRFWPYTEETPEVERPSTPPRQFIPYAPDTRIETPAVETRAVSAPKFWPYAEEEVERPSLPARQFIPYAPDPPKETPVAESKPPAFWPYTEKPAVETPSEPQGMFWPYNKAEAVSTPTPAPVQDAPAQSHGSRLRKFCCGLLVALSVAGIAHLPATAPPPPPMVTTTITAAPPAPAPAVQQTAPQHTATVTKTTTPEFHAPHRWLVPPGPAVVVHATVDQIPLETAPLDDQLIQAPITVDDTTATAPQVDTNTSTTAVADTTTNLPDSTLATTNQDAPPVGSIIGVQVDTANHQKANEILEAGSTLPLGATAVETVTALSAEHAALALGAEAQQLGAEAQAALAAGNLQQAATLGTEAKTLGTQATNLGSKAETAAHIAAPLSIVGGSVAVVDGTVDLAKGISGIKHANQLQREADANVQQMEQDGNLSLDAMTDYANVSTQIHQVKTTAEHRTERGGAKVAFGSMMIASPFTGPAAPIVGGIGAGGYLVTSIAPHVHPVVWTRAIVHHLPFHHKTAPVAINASAGPQVVDFGSF